MSNHTPDAQPMPNHAPDARLKLRTGRSLGVRFAGAAQGPTVVVLGGAPGTSRLDVENHHAPALGLGLRLVGVDRPGVGLSTRHRGGTLRTWAYDLAEAMDAIDASTYAVLALSGGACFGLAAAQHTPNRVTHLSLVAPAWLPNHRATRGMAAPNRLFWLLARNNRWAFARMMAMMAKIVTDPDKSIADTMPPVDQAVLRANPHIEARIAASFAEAARDGLDGVIDDAMLVANPVGVDPRHVAISVDLWHGDADRNVPVAMGRALAASMPDCTMHQIAGEGHVSIVATQREAVFQRIWERAQT